MRRNATTMTYGLEKSQAGLLSTFFSRSEQRTMRCDVVFGSPSADCRGTGVCKITARQIDPATNQGSCRSTTALFAANEEGRGLSMFLVRELLCTNIYRHHLRSGMLLVSEPCKLPAALVNQLGLSIRQISPGVYPVTMQNGYYKINLR